ncbi:MAG TPA: tripartite tricarboxylate transporter permease [Candidatus Nanoarchaeia archaeon]|nr:tripartite tricarboxylate transporter permease [Candidatus Nanoarchaeia archaeon]
MLIEILLFLLLGILAGTFTGLMPGIHINLIGALLVSASVSFLFFMPGLYFVVFITSMAITHTFVDFIPSVFLGCPDTDTELSVLPGHELLKEGKGHAAVMLTAYGGLAAIILTMILAFPLIVLVKKIYPMAQAFIPWILIFVSLIMVFLEKKKFYSLLAYSLAGILGLIVLNLENLNQPLLPLLTGLFGASSLIFSIKTKTQIPEQTLEQEKTSFRKPILGALIASPLCGFLPGLGSGQAAILGNTISKTDRKGFLVLLGATNTLVMAFSFLSLYAILKTRTGAAAAIKELIGIPSEKILILILIVALISGIISFFLTKKLSAFFSKKMNKINYTKLSVFTLIVLVAMVFLISGFLGLLAFAISAFTGIYCISLGVRRTQMMGCLLLPTIVLYLML